MSAKPNIVRRLLDSLVEGRQRSARRYLDSYFKDHPPAPARRSETL